MGFPAARLTDMHTCPMCMGVPAPIVWKGAYTVLTGMLPQARVTDMCVCVGPPPPVGGDPIITGAWNVLVEGLPAARMFDLTAKAGMIVTGLPTVLIGMEGAGAALMALASSLFGALKKHLRDLFSSIFASAKTLFKDGFDVALARSADNLSKFLFAEGSLEIEREGLLGRILGKLDFGLAKGEVSGHFFESFPFIGGYAKGDLLRGQATGEAGAAYGVGLNASGKAVGASGAAGLFLGSDQNNPWLEVGVAGAAGQAEAGVEGLAGYDGRRTGVAAGAKAQADGLAGDAVAEVNIPIPFTDYSIGLRGKVGATAASVGAGARGYAFHDSDTGRAHVGASGDAAAFLGIGGDIDLSVGKPYSNRSRDSAGF